MPDTIERGQLTRDNEIRRQMQASMPQVIADLRAKTADIERPRREAGYTIQNAAGDEAVVRIYDEIWWLGVNALDLVAELDAITAPTIRVEINSPGGSVFDGIAIYNALRTHPSQIVTRVDGIAASIASVIAQAGDHRIMVASSQMMIHNASALTVGDQTDHQKTVEILEVQDEIISGIYATKSNKPAEHFRGLMNAETWLTAERAVAEGLADEILDPEADKPKAKVSATLNDEIAAAVDAVEAAVTSAGRVDALRAEAGKTLSTVNRERLAGLRDSIDRLTGLPDEPIEEHPDIASLRDAIASRTASYRASLPTQFV